MKQTGFIRRLDDLGRVVIPKDLRKILKVAEGDPIEYFVDNKGELIIRKHIELNEEPDKWEKNLDGTFTPVYISK